MIVNSDSKDNILKTRHARQSDVQSNPPPALSLVLYRVFSYAKRNASFGFALNLGLLLK